MKKWLITGAIVVVLGLAAGTVNVWLKPFLVFLGKDSTQIKSLESLVKLLSEVGVVITPIVALWRRPQNDPPKHTTVVINNPPPTVVVGPAEMPQPTPDELAAVRKDYLSFLVDRYQYLEFKGMGVTDRVPMKLRLLDMYVPLKARAELPEGEAWDRDARVGGRRVSEDDAIRRHIGEPVALLDLLRENDGLIILGDPGAGKTTFLKYLALRMASGEVGDIGIGARLPVLVPLSAYAEQDVSVKEFISAYHRDRKLDVILDEVLSHGKALLLFDGLDEVKDIGRRRKVVDQVVDFFTSHRRVGNKFVLTSRIIGYRAVRPVIEGLAECTIVDFDDDEIEAFVEKWTKAVEQAARGDSSFAADEAAREQKELMEAVQRNDGVRRMASNPLLLTIIALMKRQGVSLPERRVELYKNYVEVLLKHWNLARGLERAAAPDMDIVETIRVLAPLALWMQQSSARAGLANTEDIRERLEAIYRDRGIADATGAATRLIEDVHDHTCLLVERGAGEYGFIHLTFQEYLAAVAIALRAQKDVDPAVEILAPHVGDDNWREVALLATGYMGIIQQRDEVAGDMLIQMIAMAADEQRGQAIALAGEAVVDAWPGGVARSYRDDIVERLTAAVAERVYSPAVRASAGRALGKLGDSRQGVTTIDEMPFCLVPAGPFLMGTDEGGYEDERPQHQVDIPYDYWISRYPVTNAQFKAFKEAAVYDRDPFNLPNHPVVGVTWYDALEFTRWLTERLRARGVLALDWEVRLPSEAEWEKAARGGKEISAEPLLVALQDAASTPAINSRENPLPNREYPWGNNEEEDTCTPDRGNYEDSGIGSTSAVGCFPSGRSPYGVEDMSGNVWEWTRSLYGDYPYPADESERRKRESLSASSDKSRGVARRRVLRYRKQPALLLPRQERSARRVLQHRHSDCRVPIRLLKFWTLRSLNSCR